MFSCTSYSSTWCKPHSCGNNIQIVQSSSAYTIKVNSQNTSAFTLHECGTLLDNIILGVPVVSRQNFYPSTYVNILRPRYKRVSGAAYPSWCLFHSILARKCSVTGTPAETSFAALNTICITAPIQSILHYRLPIHLFLSNYSIASKLLSHKRRLNWKHLLHTAPSPNLLSGTRFLHRAVA